jgi:hypothetical protein
VARGMDYLESKKVWLILAAHGVWHLELHLIALFFVFFFVFPRMVSALCSVSIVI